jgi:hypothetical protein
LTAIKTFLLAIPVTAALAGCGSSSSSTSAVTPPASQTGTTATTQSTASSTATSSTTASTPAASTPATTPQAAPPASKSPGKQPKPEDQLGKTPFLAAVGSAFGAFHEYISRPLRKHKVSVAQAATAAEYASRQLSAATTAAQASPSLQALSAPLAALQHQLGMVSSSLKAGHVDDAAITKAREEIYAISVKALEAGTPIQEVAPRLS